MASTSKSPETETTTLKAVKNTEADNGLTAQALKQGFLDYVLAKNRRPSSVHQLMKFLELNEREFYPFFSSLSVLEKAIWKDTFYETVKRLESEPAYKEYVARERLLAFYFTWIEVLKPQRSYVVFASGMFKTYTIASGILDEFRDVFLEYAEDVIQQGLETEEVLERPLVTSKYNLGLWTQALFILNFWVTDSSEDFIKTDEAVEKAVNLSFDLMGHTPLDSLMDFGQFIVKNKFL